MALKEIKTELEHYFVDESRQIQGEYKSWWTNGQLCVHCYLVDGNTHGELKWWYSDGQLREHCYYVDGKGVINFLEEPELYPSTDEAKTHFALKYGSGKWLP
jgi:antitoxin component YwqK of YwqJK toxin-antitoxin module